MILLNKVVKRGSAALIVGALWLLVSVATCSMKASLAQPTQGEEIRWIELFFRGGNAWDMFKRPAIGVEIQVTPIGKMGTKVRAR
jgi:hypothetical protein